jgi:hypothetical protein
VHRCKPQRSFIITVQPITKQVREIGSISSLSERFDIYNVIFMGIYLVAQNRLAQDYYYCLLILSQRLLYY